MARRGGPSRSRPTGNTWVVAVVAGVLVLGGLWLAFRGGRPRSRPAPSVTPAITLPDGEVLDAVDAQSRCEAMIRNQLPSPDSARFANRFSPAWTDPVLQGNAWRFVSTVDYRTRPGKVARARYSCVLDGDANRITVQALP